ncbi:hypothetical protein MNBD_ALPHA11-887 [hydrothermal vent metagenome]|uniref:Uncharacterized protein n=1 Tax=hydrothermal vent metagenome TaxID=652676 RepID=A0A3B0UQV2_9ZZZZ
MKLLTFWNVAGLGLGLVGVSIIVDALPGSGSAALAQSPIADNISSMIQQISPPEGRPSAQSLSKLLRVGERTYQVNFDASVSTDVLSSNVIRKIEFGKESIVSVVSTPSGVYSTDGFASKNVQYPGVEVSEIISESQDAFSAQLAVLDNIEGIKTSAMPNSNNQNCIVKSSFIYCSWR